MQKQKILLAGLALGASLGFASFNTNFANAASRSVLVGGEELYVESGTKSNTAGTATYDADHHNLALNNYNGGPIKIDTGEHSQIHYHGENTITGDTSVHRDNDESVGIGIYSLNDLSIWGGIDGSNTLTVNNENGYCIVSVWAITLPSYGESNNQIRTNCRTALMGDSGSVGANIYDTSDTFAIFSHGSSLSAFSINMYANITSSSTQFILADHVEIKGGTISATSGITDFHFATEGIHAWSDIIIDDDATVSLDGYPIGINSTHGDITINSGNVSVKNAKVGISTDDGANLIINGGTTSISTTQIAVEVKGSSITFGEGVGITNGNYFIGRLTKKLSDNYSYDYYTVYEGDCYGTTDALEVTFAEGATNKGDGELPCPADNPENIPTIVPDTGSVNSSDDNSHVVFESIIFGASAFIILAYVIGKYYKVTKNRQKVYWK